MNRLILTCLITSALITACAQTVPLTRSTACDQLHETLLEAGSRGADLAYLEAQALGREELCISSLSQVINSLGQDETIVVATEAMRVELPTELAATQSTLLPVETVEPTALPVQTRSAPAGTSGAFPAADGDAPEISAKIELPSGNTNTSNDFSLLDAPLSEPVIILAPSPSPDPTPFPTPSPTVEHAPSAIPTPISSTAPSITPEPTPSPTRTPLPTSTPVVPITTAPILDVQMMLVPPVDVIMEGESPISVQLGEVVADFTLTASVYSAHGSDRGIWSWGLDLATDSGTESVFIRSDSSIGFVNADSVTDITPYVFSVDDTQNSKNDFRIDTWNGITTLYVNGARAVSFKGLWGEAGTLCLGTNYPGSALAQGFALRTEDATVKTTALVVN